MAWFVVQIIQRVHDEVNTRGFAEDNERLELMAYQALEITLAVMAEINELDEGLYSPAQGWANPLAYARGLALHVPEPIELDDFPNLASFEERPRFQVMDNGETSQADVTGQGRRLGAKFEPVRLPRGMDVKVTVTDEGGKLPIGNTPPERWNLFFTEMGFSETESRRLTDCLLDWMDSDNDAREYGAERDFYRTKNPPYSPPNRVIRHWDELRWVEGFTQLFFSPEGIPNEYFTIFKDNVSVHNPPALNYNTMSPLVLAVIAEERGFILDDLIKLREGSPGALYSVPRILRPELEVEQLPRDNNGVEVDMSTRVQWVTITIEVTRGAAHYRLYALVNTMPDETAGSSSLYPFTIVALTQNASFL